MMLFKALIVLITFSLLGFIKVPELNKKNREYQKIYLYKSSAFPQIVLGSIVIMFLVNVLFFGEPFNFLGLLITFVSLLMLVELLLALVKLVLFFSSILTNRRFLRH